MEQPSPDLLSLLAQAVELRAAGNSWDAIAVQLRRSAHTVRHWPTRYPEVWNRLYLEAEERLVADAGAEAMFSLRRLLRTEDLWLQQNTAKFLLAQRRQARPTRAAAGPAPAHGDWAPFIAYLETLSDVQVQAFLQQFLARRMAQARPAVPAAGGEPGPAVGQ